ncbi:MAG: helix-turn-helix domain-containing protein [Acidobacteriota bacterium]
MSPEAVLAEVRALRAEVAELSSRVAASTKLGLTVEEAAALSGIGQAELRRRCAAPETSPHHLPHVRLGRKIVIPRAELERLIARSAS